MSDMQRYPFNLAANESITLPVQGTRCIVKQSRGTVEVRGVLDGGGVVRLSGLQDGQGFSGKQFKSLLITDTSGLDNDGYIIVSDESFIDNRISGDVSIINGEKARSIAGGRFFAAAYVFSAGDYPNAQLWNPSTTKNLIVTRIDFNGNLAGTYVLMGSDTALTTNTVNEANAKIGAAAGIAQVRTESTAATLSGVSLLKFFNLGSLQVAPMDLTSAPIVIPPGYGVAIGMQAKTNALLCANFEWFEEAV